MSGLMNKVKDAISGEKDTPQAGAANKAYDHHHSATEGGLGTHGANPSHSGIGQSSTSGNPLHSGTGTTSSGNNSTDPTTGTATYGSHSTGSANAGPYSSNLANKADPRVYSDIDGSNRHAHGTTGTGLMGSGTHGSSGSAYGSSTAGSHSSNFANKADPHADSDLYGSNRQGRDTTGTGLMGSSTHGTHGTTGSGGLTGRGNHDTHGTTGSGGLVGRGSHGTHGTNGSGYGSSTAGPHSSNLANKADPRVDSDRDGRRGVESGSGATGSGLTDSSTTGHHGHHGGIDGKVEDLVHGGSHHTETANRLDPHVSGGRGPLEHATVEGSGSGLGGSHGSTGGYGSPTGATGGRGSSTGTTAGPHSSNLANKADPRIDSDRDGRRGPESGTGTTGATGTHGFSTGTTGYGSSNTGPNSSSLVNEAHPRVDSDRVGRRGVETGTGSTGSTGTTGGYGSSTGTIGGYGSSAGTTLGHGSSTAGPHSSNLANKADPRVGSDLDSSGGIGSGTGTTGVASGHGSSGHHGTGSSTGTTGQHGSNVGTNGGYGSSTRGTLDPRVG